MKIYHYSKDNFEYCFSEEADESPLEPGKYLIPAHATDIPVPKCEPEKTPIFNEKEQKWEIVDYDINKQVWHKKTLNFYQLTKYIDPHTLETNDLTLVSPLDKYPELAKASVILITPDNIQWDDEKAEWVINIENIKKSLIFGMKRYHAPFLIQAKAPEFKQRNAALKLLPKKETDELKKWILSSLKTIDEYEEKFNNAETLQELSQIEKDLDHYVKSFY